MCLLSTNTRVSVSVRHSLWTQYNLLELCADTKGQSIVSYAPASMGLLVPYKAFAGQDNRRFVLIITSSPQQRLQPIVCAQKNVCLRPISGHNPVPLLQHPTQNTP